MPKPPNVNPEAEAQRLLDRLGIATIPVLVDKIAKQLGAQLRYSPLDNELSGMLFIRGDIPIIGINALHHPNRQRFSIAHEIGHLQLHRDIMKDEVHVDKEFSVPVLNRDGKAAEGTDLIEIQANRFAAALLIPARFLAELLASASSDIEDEKPLEIWAKKFKVSKAMLQFRIKNFSPEQVTKKRA